MKTTKLPIKRPIFLTGVKKREPDPEPTREQEESAMTEDEFNALLALRGLFMEVAHWDMGDGKAKSSYWCNLHYIENPKSLPRTIENYTFMAGLRRDTRVGAIRSTVQRYWAGEGRGGERHES